MDDALLRRGRIDIVDAELRGVAAERVELLRAFGVCDRDQAPAGIDARRRRQIVVGHRQRQLGATDAAPGGAQPLERLRAGDFVDEVAVDVDQARAIVARFDDVRVPDLFVQGLWSGCHDGARVNRNDASAKGCATDYCREDRLFTMVRRYRPAGANILPHAPAHASSLSAPPLPSEGRRDAPGS